MHYAINYAIYIVINLYINNYALCIKIVSFIESQFLAIIFQATIFALVKKFDNSYLPHLPRFLDIYDQTELGLLH